MRRRLASYSMRGDKVIVRIDGQDLIYNEIQLQAAIENVTRNKTDYATEEAWRDHLAWLEGALKFLKGDQS